MNCPNSTAAGQECGLLSCPICYPPHDEYEQALDCLRAIADGSGEATAAHLFLERIERRER